MHYEVRCGQVICFWQWNMLIQGRHSMNQCEIVLSPAMETMTCQILGLPWTSVLEWNDVEQRPQLTYHRHRTLKEINLYSQWPLRFGDCCYDDLTQPSLIWLIQALVPRAPSGWWQGSWFCRVGRWKCTLWHGKPLGKLWFALTWMANQLFNEYLPLGEEVGKQNIDSVYYFCRLHLARSIKKRDPDPTKNGSCMSRKK